MSRSANLLWVNKDAKSDSLSHSDDVERIQLLSHAQRTSRLVPRKARSPKSSNPTKRKKKTRPDEDGSSISSPPVRAPPNLYPAWSEDERRSFLFFQQMTVRKIVTLHRDHVFWTEHVPQMANKHEAFRHLVVAIASTHELLLQVDPSRLDAFALTQCNKATELLRACTDCRPSYLVVSCILMVAYSLLRCDYRHADLGVENGLKILYTAVNGRTPCCTSGEDGIRYKHILTRLSKSHGFKLWAPDISHQFEKSPASRSCMAIETDLVKGPFTSTAEVLKAYKDILIELVAKIMRNLARGAYLDPKSPLAQSIIRQLSKAVFYWGKLYSQLPQSAERQRLELKQLRVGLNYAPLLFFTKVISPQEKVFDSYSNILENSLDLAEELLSAYQEGKTVLYMDRVVNGALFSMAMCSHCPTYRNRAIRVLQGQAGSVDGLDHWTRATIIELLQAAEMKVWGERDLHGILPRDRITFVNMSCHGKTVRLDYAVVRPRSESFDFIEKDVDWEPRFGPGTTSKMVHDCCQGIMAAYRTYGKPRPSEAPLGYVREMRYDGRPVQVCWDESWRPDVED